MRIEDLDRIRELADTLNFNSALLKRLSTTQPRLVIGHGRDEIEISMPPSMAVLVTESIRETVTAKISETEADLTALGVDFSANPVSARSLSATGGEADRTSGSVAHSDWTFSKGVAHHAPAAAPPTTVRTD